MLYNNNSPTPHSKYRLLINKYIMCKFRSVKHYSIFYRDDNLMDCDSTGGCNGSGCCHSDCSYCNFHLTFMYNANVQERYMEMLVIVHAAYQNVM